MLVLNNFSPLVDVINFSKRTMSSSAERKSVVAGTFFPDFRAFLASVSACEYICWLRDWLWCSFGWRYCVLSLSTGINFKEVNPESSKAIFGEIHASIDSLAFTFGNVWVLREKTLSWFGLTLNPFGLICVGTRILSWISVSTKPSVFSFWIWRSWRLSPEFLTSLWEMWTAAQGWGPPRPGEAGWANLFQHCAVKHSSFQKSQLGA